MWGSLLSAALHVLTLVQSAEVRFGVVWPEGRGVAAVKGCRGVSDRLMLADSSILTASSSMHHLFCRGLSLCFMGGAVVALLP